MFEQVSYSGAPGHAPTFAWAGSSADALELKVLERLPVAVAVIDTRGRLLFCNGRARELESNCAMGLDTGGRIFFRDELFERRFRRAVHQLVHEAATGREGAMLAMNRARWPQMPLFVSIEILQEDFLDVPRKLLVTFTDPACAPSEARMGQLLRSFDLTPAEQKLSRHLATGGRLDDAAQAFGLSKHTVRNQLRAVFAKLGVQRQVDLVRLLLAGCGVFA
ncbi:MAG: helix-turn-helix transcriptional regulator [Rhodanobacteraceae bacterium]